MRIIYKEPGKPARTMVIDGSLQTMQQLVGGYIEHVHVKNSVGVLVNEDGKSLGLEPNLLTAYDVLRGPVIFIGEGEEDFRGLTDREVEDIQSWLKPMDMARWVK